MMKIVPIERYPKTEDCTVKVWHAVWSSRKTGKRRTSAWTENKEEAIRKAEAHGGYVEFGYCGGWAF
jgi:hypothetical protein